MIRPFPALLALCAASLPAAAAEAPPAGLTLGTDSVAIPFANAAPDGGPLTGSPRILVRFDGGRATAFIMDTGSQGVVVSRDVWSPPPGAPALRPGHIVYTSSGVVLSGSFYDAALAIGSGAATAVLRVPALVVDRQGCRPRARACVPHGNAAHVAMFGVGFGQEGAGQPEGAPPTNPFLNVVSINGRPVTLAARGYVITPHGVTLGLTRDNTAGFRFAALERDEAGGDWRPIRATITVNGVSGPATVLNDTGIRYMYLRPPPGADVRTVPEAEAPLACVRFKPCAAAGTRIRVAFGDPSAPALVYDVAIGRDGLPDPDAAAPEWVTVLNERPEGFVNTGYHFFNAYSYLYDDADGYVGFRANPEREPGRR
ncbi:hypothetical protein DFR50_1217 [Roseiarcus fermentans]|uniref:Aspartyl protease n=1 Tax=Roseiarcus fermentans TaxID=1473586 RepID=A0A366F4S6_9HYPH|nr:hypothetical protein [Roseiarcus fermentans]RBP09663.1 hypothetical protein DFR50_1217 [Roseiarcus fermentans]